MVKKLKPSVKKQSTPKQSNNQIPDNILAITGLVVNTMFLPGLGSIIGGRTKTGIIQLVLFIISIPLILVFLIGIPMMFGVWIWALVTGIQMVKEVTPQKEG